MPAPSPLSITTSSLLRLIKEERSYHHELQLQESKVETLQRQSQTQNQNQDSGGDENAAWKLGQEKRAIDETKALFPGLRARIQEAVGRLEGLVEAQQGRGGEGNAGEIARAKEALAGAETSRGEGA